MVAGVALLKGLTPWVQVGYKMDTMGMHERGLADVGTGGGLLSRGDLPSDEPRGGVAGRERAVRGVDERDRRAVDGAAGRVSGDAGARGGARGSVRAAAVADARTARDGD